MALLTSLYTHCNPGEQILFLSHSPREEPEAQRHHTTCTIPSRSLCTNLDLSGHRVHITGPLVHIPRRQQTTKARKIQTSCIQMVLQLCTGRTTCPQNTVGVCHTLCKVSYAVCHFPASPQASAGRATSRLRNEACGAACTFPWVAVGSFPFNCVWQT